MNAFTGFLLGMIFTSWMAVMCARMIMIDPLISAGHQAQAGCQSTIQSLQTSTDTLLFEERLDLVFTP